MYFILFNGVAMKSRCAVTIQRAQMASRSTNIPHTGGLDAALYPIADGQGSTTIAGTITYTQPHQVFGQPPLLPVPNPTLTIGQYLPPDGTMPWGPPPGDLSKCYQWSRGSTFSKLGPLGVVYRPISPIPAGYTRSA